MDIKRYERYCDLVDAVVGRLLYGETEAYINYCDIYRLQNVDYMDIKRELLKEKGIELKCMDDNINNRFILKIERR